MLRRTKIIATIGPATNKPHMLKELILTGVDLLRINMSHGVTQEHRELLNNISKVSKNLAREVGVLVDLQGPKLRVAKFKEKVVVLEPEAKFILDVDLDANVGTQEMVGVDYKNLPKDVKAGDILLFDDGRIVMEVASILGNQVHCVVKIGGKLADLKGFNRKGGGLSTESCTEKDKQDILLAAKHNVDYIALSFVRTAKDILHVKEILKNVGSQAGVIAKIERIEALDSLDEIIQVSDAVMVARGDLGVEIEFAELPAIQKHIIKQARTLNRAVITATQMMESMTHSSIPTRAEVSDVANAVLEGTDAVMLSGETAIGEYPLQVVKSIAQVCVSAEKQKITQISQHRLESYFTRADEAIAMAAMYTANHLKVKAIIALTESGSTPLWMSRIRSGIPIYGVSRNKYARGRMTLYRGVYPINFDVTCCLQQEVIREALTALRKQGIVQIGDQIIITMGDILGVVGHANAMKIITVEQRDE